MRTPARRPRVAWLALALLLTATVADAAEPVSRAAESIDGAARPAASTTPRIGRIFFSPAERRGRRRAGLAATSTSTPTAAPRERRVVNGALRSSTEERAVWVDGAAVENSARERSAWTDRNGNVWLMNGTQGTHLVKPGQSIDRNGVIEDLLPPGAVARR
jgi:hypothetical protein